MNVAEVKALALPKLIELQHVVAEAIAEKQALARDTFLDEMREKAQALGLDFASLVGGKAAKRTRKPVVPKYRDTENAANVWAGRGKQPKWLVEALAHGRKLEDFLIATDDGDTTKAKRGRRKAGADA